MTRKTKYDSLWPCIRHQRRRSRSLQVPRADGKKERRRVTLACIRLHRHKTVSLPDSTQPREHKNGQALLKLYIKNIPPTVHTPSYPDMLPQIHYIGTTHNPNKSAAAISLFRMLKPKIKKITNAIHREAILPCLLFNQPTNI